MKIIASHGGPFHSDDVFGVAVIQAVALRDGGTTMVVRTRDPQKIAQADYAVDVGGVWDPHTGRFDHHQKGFDGARSSGVMYASAGLVWKTHGEAFVRAVLDNSMALYGPATAENVKRIAEQLDDDVVQYLDMVDTGQRHPSPVLYGFASVLDSFNLPGVRERQLAEMGSPGDDPVGTAQLKAFLAAVDVARQHMTNLVLVKMDALHSSAIVRAANIEESGRVLVLPCAGLTWSEVVCNEMPDVRFVVYPESSEQHFHVRTVPVSPDSFTARLDLPAAWAGLRDSALAEVTQIEDAVFCHNGRFIAGARSLAGALELARQALAHLPR